jgi:hypothetical protein
MRTEIMEEVAEIFSMAKDTKTLKTYFIPSSGNWRYEVKDHEKVLYKGESFQKAQSVYEQVCRH